MNENIDAPVLDHIPTTEELLSIYNNQEEEDPSSPNYKRVLIRPKIHLIKTFFHLLICLLVVSIIGVGLEHLFHIRPLTIIIPIILLIIYFVLKIKKIAIWFVKCYQKFAPDSIRNKCRFEPSCSEYMIRAIEKYGFVKGVAKGINRLKRCCPPNGGYDEP